VSARTGLPIPTLSKLENGQTSFSYDKLMQVSRGLELDIVELLSPTGFAQPSTSSPGGRRSIVRAGEGAAVNSGTYSYLHLAADLLNKRFVPMLGEHRAQSLEEFGEMIRHPGEEFVFVLEGTLELHSSIYAPVVLQKGDSIFFDSDMGHAYIAVGPSPCKVLSICSGSHDP
jgi:transcriptional regulator with XRE-family HTH domain